MDGPWRVAVCVFPTPHVDEAQRIIVFEIVSLIGIIKPYPNYPPCRTCDW